MIKKSLRLTTLLLALLFLTACLGTPAARHNNAGNDNFENEEYEEAVKEYITAQRENPDLPEPYYNAGGAFHRQGNLESAIIQGKQAARQAEGELAQNSYYNLGNSYFKEEDWPAAIEAYKEALRLNPDDEQAKYNLELALKQLQQQQQQQQQQQGEGSGQQQPQQGGNGQQPQQQGQGQGEEEQENQGQGQGEQEQDQPGGGGQQEPDDEGQPSSPDEQGSGGSRGLTPQEAEQLLDALGQDSQTLKERLQQDFFAPGRPPEEDW